MQIPDLKQKSLENFLENAQRVGNTVGVDTADEYQRLTIVGNNAVLPFASARGLTGTESLEDMELSFLLTGGTLRGTKAVKYSNTPEGKRLVESITEVTLTDAITKSVLREPTFSYGITINNAEKIHFMANEKPERFYELITANHALFDSARVLYFTRGRLQDFYLHWNDETHVIGREGHRESASESRIRSQDYPMELEDMKVTFSSDDDNYYLSLITPQADIKVTSERKLTEVTFNYISGLMKSNTDWMHIKNEGLIQLDITH